MSVFIRRSISGMRVQTPQCAKGTTFTSYVRFFCECFTINWNTINMHMLGKESRWKQTMCEQVEPEKRKSLAGKMWQNMKFIWRFIICVLMNRSFNTLRWGRWVSTLTNYNDFMCKSDFKKQNFIEYFQWWKSQKQHQSIHQRSSNPGFGFIVFYYPISVDIWTHWVLLRLLAFHGLLRWPKQSIDMKIFVTNSIKNASIPS